MYAYCVTENDSGLRDFLANYLQQSKVTDEVMFQRLTSGAVVKNASKILTAVFQ